MEEQLAPIPTPYDITDIPHFPLSAYEILIPIIIGTIVAFVVWELIKKRFIKTNLTNIKIELESFISASNPTREDLALIIKKFRRSHGTAFSEAESLLFQKEFDVNKAKEVIKKLTYL